MGPNVEQILKASKEISMSSKRGEAQFHMDDWETLGVIRDCLERQENRKRCAEIEENLNRSIKNATK